MISAGGPPLFSSGCSLGVTVTRVRSGSEAPFSKTTTPFWTRPGMTIQPFSAEARFIRKERAHSGGSRSWGTSGGPVPQTPWDFGGMARVSEVQEKQWPLTGHAHQRPDAASAHPRPGYPLPGCFPAEPDSVSPGGWQLTVPIPARREPDTFGHPSHASENPAAKPRLSAGRGSDYAHASAG